MTIALTAASPAFAAQTPWQEVAPDVRLRLIADDVRTPAGTTLLGLEIDMPQSYKTYWVIPGEAGIPTQIDWTGSSGLASSKISWPYPSAEVSGGLTDFVYHGPTVLPIEAILDADKPRLKASVVMGVCSDICVPVMADFTLDLDFAKLDRGQSLRITQALAQTPIDWDKPTPPFPQISYDTTLRGLAVSIGDSAVDPASLIASTPDPTLIFGPPQKSREPDLVFLPLLGNAAQKGFEGGPVQITFMTNDGPYQVSADVGLAAAATGGQ